MRRREFLGATSVLAAWQIRSWKRVAARLGPPALAMVLRGGRYFTAGAWRVGDVGIDVAGRLRFGADLQGGEVIDVSGLVVAPGFIDILADNSTDPDRTFPIFEKYKVADGVTTALQMHGGSADCGGLHARLGSRPHRINYGFSTSVMAVRGRTADRSARLRLVERNLAEGALGVSHSLEYQPTPFEELVRYARLAARYDRPVFLHLRYSDAERELAGVDEAVRIAAASGARVHIAHLHSTGGTFHMEEALRRLRAANAAGLVLTACVYPYSYWAAYLSSKRFDPGWRRRFGLDYGDLTVVGTGERLTAATFPRHRQRGTLVAVPEGTMPPEKTWELALREPFCVIGSDGGIQGEPRANSHPRGAGCFATALRQGIVTGVPLEEILAKMTVLPAAVVSPGLAERGVLEEGAIADLTVFDPLTVRGNATLENPNQFSSGIDLVLVNGRPAFWHRQLAHANGRAIRY